MGKENIAMLHSIDSSLTTVFENANNYSKLILADRVVQEQMKTGNIVSDFERQQLLISQIYSITQFSEREKVQIFPLKKILQNMIG